MPQGSLLGPLLFTLHKSMECIYPKQCLDTLESKLLTGLSLTNDLLTLEKLNVLKSENHSLNNQRKSYVKTAIILQAKCFPVSVNNKLTWKLNIKYQTKGLNCNTVLIWRLLMTKITKHFILLTCCSTYDCIELWGNTNQTSTRSFTPKT